MNRIQRKLVRRVRHFDNRFMRSQKPGETEDFRKFDTLRTVVRKLMELRMGHVWDKPLLLLDAGGRLKKNVKKESRMMKRSSIIRKNSLMCLPPSRQCLADDQPAISTFEGKESEESGCANCRHWDLSDCLGTMCWECKHDPEYPLGHWEPRKESEDE